MARSAAEMMLAETPAQEAAEPEVQAVPKIGRAALRYMEPRPGLDGLQYFSACSSCQSFVSEAMMGGAVMGSRCVKFGSQFSVSDDDHCDLYEPWNSGLPCEAVTIFYAGELRKGVAGGISPWSAGYKAKTCVQCQACRFYDAGEGKVAGVGECEAMESLNEKSGNLFEMLTAVKSRGWCSMWTAPEPAGPEMAGSLR